MIAYHSAYMILLSLTNKATKPCTFPYMYMYIKRTTINIFLCIYHVQSLEEDNFILEKFLYQQFSINNMMRNSFTLFSMRKVFKLYGNNGEISKYSIHLICQKFVRQNIRIIESYLTCNIE